MSDHAQDHASPATLAKIAAAQVYRGAPPSERLAPERRIGDVLADRRNKGLTPYLIYYDDAGERTEFTYGDFLDRVWRTAALLSTRLDAKRGDRIATMTHNHPDTAVLYFAAWLLGCVVVPVNVGEDDERVQFIIENSGARIVCVRHEYIERFEGVRPKAACVEHVLQLSGEVRDGCHDYRQVLQRMPSAFEPPEEVHLDDEALIVYTSGTTGPPKGVLLTQYNILADVRAMARWHGIDETQRLMCVLPIHHVNGMIVTLMTPMYCGGSVVLNQKFHAKTFWRRLADEHVHIVSVVPTLLAFLCEADEDITAYELSQFRHVICGAGPLTVDLAGKFEDRFNVRIAHGYGLSETTCYSCCIPVDLPKAEHDKWMRDYGYPAIGIPLDVNEMAIHDPNGEPLGPDEKGEIVLRGHNVMKAYFKRPDANADTFAHEWFRSGDEGFYKEDAEGRSYFFITGRIKELIIRGGVNLSPFEIDEVLMSIPGVRCGLAVGFDNSYYGEEVGAYVDLEPNADLSAEEIIAMCAEHLPFNKTPKVVLFGADIPVTSTGKYQRNKLKPLFAEYADLQFRAPKK